VFENVAFGLRMQKTPAADISPRVTEALPVTCEPVIAPDWVCPI